MVIYYESNFTISERIIDAQGVPLDLTEMDFDIRYSTTGYNVYVVSKHGSETVRCSIDTDDHSLLHVTLEDHGLKPGQLVREFTFRTDPPAGWDGNINDITKKQYAEDCDAGRVFLGRQSSACGPAAVKSIFHADFIKGDSAYKIAVKDGFVGTEEEWLASLKGETGETGPQGPRGAQGEQGFSGGMLFPVMDFDAETGVLTISGLSQEVDRIRYDEETSELIIRI